MTTPGRQDLERFLADYHVDLKPIVDRYDETFAALARCAERLPQPKQSIFDTIDGRSPGRPLTPEECASYWSTAISIAAARGLSIWHARKFLVPEILADDPAARRSAHIDDLQKSIAALLADLSQSALSAPYRPVEVEYEQRAAKALKEAIPLIESIRRPSAPSRKNQGTRREDVFRSEFLGALVETWRIAVGQPTFTAHVKSRPGAMSFVDLAELAWEQVLSFPASGGKFRSAVEKIAQRKGWTSLPPSALCEKSALTEF